jgi:MFS family permease
MRVGSYFYGWNIVGVAMVFQSITFGMTVYGYGFWVEPWSAEFGASRGEIMIGISLMNLVSAILSPFVGHALDKFSIRWIVSLGACALAAGFLLISTATGLGTVLASYMLLVSIAVVLVGPMSASTLMAKWFTRNRGLAIGLSSVGTSLGGFIMPMVIAYMLIEYGWRQAHLYLAIMALVLIIPLTLWVVRNSPEEKGVAPESPLLPPVAETDGKAAASEMPTWTTRTVLRDRTFWTIAAALGLMMMPFSGTVPNLVPYALEAGVSIADAAVMMTLLAGAGILSKIVMGSLADRVPLRFLVWGNNLMLITPILLLMGTPSFAGLLMISALMGLSTGGFTPLIGAAIGARFGPLAFGRVFGLLNPFMLIFALTGPPLMGYLFDETGSYNLPLQIFTGMIIASAIVTFWLRITPARAET